jgi:hypothetical protein
MSQWPRDRGFSRRSSCPQLDLTPATPTYLQTSRAASSQAFPPAKHFASPIILQLPYFPCTYFLCRFISLCSNSSGDGSPHLHQHISTTRGRLANMTSSQPKQPQKGLPNPYAGGGGLPNPYRLQADVQAPPVMFDEQAKADSKKIGIYMLNPSAS